MREEAIRQIAQVLSRRQKTAFNKMLGDPFDLTRLAPNNTQVQGILPPAGEPAALEPVPPATSPQPPSAPMPKREKRAQNGPPPDQKEGP